MTTVFPDVSEFQKPVDNSYTREWLSFRICDGEYRDHNAAHNLAWARTAASTGRLAGYTGYVVFRPGAATFTTATTAVGEPDRHITVMIDVESWSGAIRGDHSTGITALAEQFAVWLGDRRRVLVYGNQGDLASIYPHRPAWLKVVVASYGSQRPTVHNMIAWQYSDGDTRWPLPAGLPRSTPPFGRCDHNTAPGLTPAQFAAALGVGPEPTPPKPKPTPAPIEEFTMDADAKKRFDALDKEIADLRTFVHDIFTDEHGHQFRAETFDQIAANAAATAVETTLGARLDAIQKAIGGQA